MSAPTMGPNTPPPARSAAPGSRPNTTLRRVLLTVGSVLLILLLVTAGYRIAVIGSFEDHSGSYEVTDPLTSVDVRGTDVEIDVRYGPVDAAVIDFDQGRSDLVLRHSVRGGELQVIAEPRVRGPFRVGNWSGTWGGTWGGELHITLPQADDPVDLSARSTAGDVYLDGDFGAVDLQTTAASSTVSGSAESFNADATAGSLTATDLGVSGSIEVQGSAGGVAFTLAELPSSISVDATASDVRFEIPPGQYRIDAEATAGTVTQQVSSSSGADTLYRFRTTAGSIELIERG